MPATEKHLRYADAIYAALIGCSVTAITLVSLYVYLGASSCN